MIPIKIFYHIFATQDYLNIVREQLALIKSSGLYDRCSEIKIGFLGSEESLLQARALFLRYPKITVVNHHTDEKKYEFHTLHLLKEDCDVSEEKFYALYIHTKGVTFSHHKVHNEGGTFWREYMDSFLIGKWKEWYSAISFKDNAYDIAGVKAVPARISGNGHTHLSGNYFAANSEYIKTLAPIHTLNKSNRFDAEAWSCSREPIIYNMCGLFVDYNTKGNYKDTDLTEYCL